MDQNVNKCQCQSSICPHLFFPFSSFNLYVFNIHVFGMYFENLKKKEIFYNNKNMA